MKTSMLKRIFALFLATILLYGTACTSAPSPSSSIASDEIASIIEKYRQEIPLRMQQENVAGLAVAVVDDQSILWAEGFGYTDWDEKIPVTPSTLFSIQSMSKSFTATAVMFAVQDRLVDLDEPITTYLPDFHVNSIFEEHPEKKITLQMLLSHTAGFAHEASYGGNFTHPVYSFEKHIASISDTWLKFPVGTRYSYSNLGIDLAGYILQVRSGRPFVQYVQQKVLDPLGMKDSTLDVSRIRRTSTRAIGHEMGELLRPAVDFLLIPSGGVWTTATDMTRYLQFHINSGLLDGDRLLPESLAETMYTPPSIPAQYAYQDSSYAFGITVNTRNGARHFQHGGGGWGFNSSMVWYPELKLGAVVLCNADLNDDLVVQLNEGLLDSIIAGTSDLYTQRAQSGVQVEPAFSPEDDEYVLPDTALQNLIVSKALPEDESTEKRMKSFAGTYIVVDLDATVEFITLQGELNYFYQGLRTPLTEVQPGLFFSPYGDAVDFHERPPTFGGIPLIKLDSRTGTLYIVFYALCGLVFLSALFYWPVRTLFRRIRRKNAPVDAVAVRPPLSSRLVWSGMLAALASFLSLLFLIIIALTPNMIYILAAIPLWRPYVDLLWWQFAILSLPYVNLVLAIVIASLAALSMSGNTGGRIRRFNYLIVALALLAFNLAIIL
jgi:CubicO group peptidase (beta-lactamase class C family)